MEEKEQKGNPPSPSSSSRGSAWRGAVERMKLLAADFPKTHSPIRRFNTGSLKAGAKCVACIRASLSLSSFYLLACDRRFPVTLSVLRQINRRGGERENNREGQTQRGQCVGSRIVIVSTRYLDQPASRLGLPRHTGVKDLLFLFLHWNPIGKSAEAFVRALSFNSPTPSRSFFLSISFSPHVIYTHAPLLSPPLCFVSAKRRRRVYAVIRIRTSSNRGNKTTPTFPRAFLSLSLFQSFW